MHLAMSTCHWKAHWPEPPNPIMKKGRQTAPFLFGHLATVRRSEFDLGDVTDRTLIGTGCHGGIGTKGG